MVYSEFVFDDIDEYYDIHDCVCPCNMVMGDRVQQCQICNGVVRFDDNGEFIEATIPLQELYDATLPCTVRGRISILEYEETESELY